MNDCSLLSWSKRLGRFFASSGILAAVLVVLFMLTNRYIFGWDDQHLEVPLLKHLIDPTLFQGDYYVESLKENFTTFVYPILSRFITVDQIPAAYLTLYILFRYFLFLVVYRFWRLVTKDVFLAFLCTAALFLLVRPEEFIKRTFSHQVVSYSFVFAGIYLFYRGRYLASALVYGLAANFHALYGLFAMIYLSSYLLFFHRKPGWLKLFLKSAAGFVIMAAPFLVWTVARALKTRLGSDPHLYDDWINLYRISCGQNFLLGIAPLSEAAANLKVFLKNFSDYLLPYVVYIFLYCFSEDFRKDIRIHAIACAVLFLTVVSFLFTYIWPSHFILDLNLVRNDQFFRFFVGGYMLIFAYNQAQRSWMRGVLLAFLLAFIGGKEPLDVSVILVGMGIFFCLEIGRNPFDRFKILRQCLLAIAAFALAVFLSRMLDAWLYPIHRLQRVGGVAGIIILASVARFFIPNDWGKRWSVRLLIAAPLIVAVISFGQLHYNYVQMTRYGGGFWQLQRNWEDMQFYVRDHTPKNAMILTPYDMEMGGFRIHSNRKVVVCFRDCGIIGFDYKATVEWQKRIKDVESFKVMVQQSFGDALVKAITKYHANYIVFMKYAAPADSNILHKVYENEAFVLFNVNAD